jgi:hypothetical protein
MPGSAGLFGARGPVRVQGTMDGVPFASSSMALSDGTHKLPVTTKLHEQLGEQVGDTVEVHLLERLSRTTVTTSRRPP